METILLLGELSQALFSRIWFDAYLANALSGAHSVDSKLTEGLERRQARDL